MAHDDDYLNINPIEVQSDDEFGDNKSSLEEDSPADENEETPLRRKSDIELSMRSPSPSSEASAPAPPVKSLDAASFQEPPVVVSSNFRLRCLASAGLTFILANVYLISSWIPMDQVSNLVAMHSTAHSVGVAVSVVLSGVSAAFLATSAYHFFSEKLSVSENQSSTELLLKMD